MLDDKYEKTAGQSNYVLSVTGWVSELGIFITESEWCQLVRISYKFKELSY